MSDRHFSIAILGSRGIPASYGGFETFAEELSVRLVQRGHEVTVFCEDTQDYCDKIYKGIRLEYVKTRPLGPLNIVWFDTLCMLKAAGKHDLILLLGYGAGAFVWVPRFFGTPVWINMDGLEWKRSKWPWYGRLFLRINEWCAVQFSSRVIADSKGIRDYLKRKYGEDITCDMIPYGAEIVEKSPDTTLLHLYTVEPNNYYLVVCRLEPENHVAEIIHGFVASASQKKLIIVGNVDVDTSYVKKLKQTNDHRVHFVGTIYEKNKLHALRYYAFGYFHGHSVGGTNPSLLEALGCGNLVIAHDNPFNREVAAECGRYFTSVSDISEIINSIEFQSNQDTISDMAQDRIRKIYNWERITDLYEDLFQTVLGVNAVNRKVV